MDDLTTGTPTTSADSSPAPGSHQAALNSLTAEQREHWETTGEFPSSESEQASSQESPPAPSGDQTTPTGVQAPPASEPGTPTKGTKLRERNAALDEEIAKLNARLKERARLRSELGTEAMPQSPAPTAPSASSAAGKPDLRAFVARIGEEGGYDSYEAAVEAFTDARDLFKAAQTARETEERTFRQEVTRVAQTFSQQIADAEIADPAFRASIAPELWNLKPYVAEQPVNGQMPQREARHDLADALMTSEHGPALLQHLSQHKDVYRAVLQSPNPLAVYRAIGRIEGSFKTSAPPPPAQEVSAPPITKAPPPPKTLGSKPSVTEEEWQSAVARGDFSAYERAANSREFASVK